MTVLTKNQQVHFSLVEPLSLIPSYATDPDLACNASQYFLSVSLQGVARVVESMEEKIEILTALMQRLQPQGGYQPISLQDQRYVKQVKATAVVCIVPSQITAKFKLGQNLKPEQFQAVIETLEQRGTPEDLQTLSWMKKAQRLSY